MSMMHNIVDPKRHQLFVPKNTSKYIGKSFPVIRSSWERKFAQWCDLNPNVITWSSETLVIPYRDRIRNKDRRYYPDFVIKILDKDKNETIWVIEIKPYKEVKAPKITSKKSEKTKLYEKITYENNLEKWRTAENYCKKYGYKFKILTEKDLFV